MVLKKRCMLWVMLLALPVAFLVGQELHVEQGGYVKKARSIIQLLESVQGDNIAYGAQLIEFGKFCGKQGLYSSAASTLNHAFLYGAGGWKKSLAETSSLNAIYWDFLGHFSEHIETWHENALIYYKEVGKADTHGHIDAYTHAARYYSKEGKWIRAEDCYREALRLQQKYNALSADEYTLLKNEIAHYYLQRLRPVESENMLSSLLRSKGKLADAVTLNNQAHLAIQRKEYEQAENLLERAIVQYRASLPTLSDMLKTTLPPEFMSGLGYAAFYYSARGEKEKALHIYIALNELLHETVKEYIPYMVYTDKSHLWMLMRNYFAAIQQFAVANSDLEGAIGLLYDNNQLKKNLFVNSPIEIVDLKQLEADAYLRHIDEKMEVLTQNEVSYQTHRGSDFIAKYKNDLLGIAYERDRLTYLRKKQWRKPFKGIGWRNVQAAMTLGDAVLEFLEIGRTPKNEKIYGVLLLTKQSEAPKLITLPSDSRLRVALNSNARADRLRVPVWRNIEKELPADVTSLFLSPAGLINTISFAEIKSEGKYLCEKYELYYLLNSEDVDLVNAEKYGDDLAQTSKNIYLFGGADYGLPPHVISDVRSQGFGYLPGSKDEVNSISRTLDPIWKTHRFIGKDATEQNLRTLSGKSGVSVLHISTHGFYLPYDSNILTKGINNNGKSGYFDPLLRTGIMLSGANHAWKDPTFFDMANDCIVTAMDLGNIRLPYTELVVLSACNTGLGEVKDGEGVAGMQQALRMAGVRTMIFSLSDVPDKETAELMTYFYTYWQNGRCKSQAFVMAQRVMKDKYPDNPEKWAGFILVQ